MKSGACIILAAGRSLRFGNDKRLAVLESGKHILQQSIERNAACFDRVIVAVREGESAADFPWPVASNVIFFPATNARFGMGSVLSETIASGLFNNASFVAVTLGDKPWVKIATINKLKHSFKSERIVVPVCGGIKGHPVIFDKCYLDELMQLRGEEGGKIVLERNQQSVLVVECNDRGTVDDIDRPDHLFSENS